MHVIYRTKNGTLILSEVHVLKGFREEGKSLYTINVILAMEY